VPHKPDHRPRRVNMARAGGIIHCAIPANSRTGSYLAGGL
jgi:hypothetical protein